jgi:hypothetical protein
MHGYINLINNATIYALDEILEAASIDSTITDAQYSALTLYAQQRATNILFNRA